jgi:site-specific recombinase XerC
MKKETGGWWIMLPFFSLIRMIQLLLGHRSLQTTMIYTHVIQVTKL